MSDIVLSRPGGGAQLDPMTVARVFRESGMFPDIHHEAAAAAKLIIGRDLGISDYDAMSGLHIIKGKAVLAANLMAAAIKRSGKYDYRATCTDTECRIQFLGRTASGWEPIGETTFTMEDAKRAGLNGDNWRKYPRAMLFARGISAGYKQHCPDALGCAPVYVEAHGETEITEDAPPPPVRKALPAPAPAPTREERQALFDPKPKAALPAPAGEIPIDGGTDRAPDAAAPNVVRLRPGATRVTRVDRKTGGAVWRVDVDGEEMPYAITEAALADSVQAQLAFKVTCDATFRTNSDGKRIIQTIEEVGHG
jgi:hypothetical protein